MIKYVKKTRPMFLMLVVMCLVGCVTQYVTTNTAGDEIVLPKTLGYSVKALNTSKGFYDTIMKATNDAEKSGAVTYEQVEEVIVIAKKYQAAQNIAQKGVDLWYNTLVTGEGTVDKNAVVVEVLRFMSMIPSMVTDINALLGTELKIPSYLNIGNLMDVVDKDDAVNVDVSGYAPKPAT